MRSMSFNVEKTINNLTQKLNVTVDENRKMEVKLRQVNSTTRVIARIRPPLETDRGDELALSAPADN